MIGDIAKLFPKQLPLLSNKRKEPRSRLTDLISCLTADVIPPLEVMRAIKCHFIGLFEICIKAIFEIEGMFEFANDYVKQPALNSVNC